MVYTELTKMAMIICLEAHRGQFDKGGYPYCFHPIHLAEQMDDEDSTCVALLHDVIEDNPSYSLAYMGSTAMMPPAVVEALRLLTHDKDNVSYEDYLKGIKSNKLATKVKLADLRHNLDASRLPKGKANPNQAKYEFALSYLLGVK
ncbi:MAG: GTP pyrophosphokinase [Bacilli bacterium]|jgi:(p)ppGpp synthase/HD superfamily hydrolase|nr:GTP pyrophosphokinase [Bacilli bacterium]